MKRQQTKKKASPKFKASMGFNLSPYSCLSCAGHKVFFLGLLNHSFKLLLLCDTCGLCQVLHLDELKETKRGLPSYAG